MLKQQPHGWSCMWYNDFAARIGWTYWLSVHPSQKQWCALNQVSFRWCPTFRPLKPQIDSIYIYTLGAGGSPKVLWVGYCECSKIVISLWWNVSFWRSHFLHRMVFCADDFFFDPRVDWWKIHHSYIYTCEKRVICVVKWRFWKCHDGPSVQKCCGPQYFWS